MDLASIGLTLGDTSNNIAAGGDVALLAEGGDVTISSALAGDDVVIRGEAVTVAGNVTSGFHYAVEGNGSLPGAGDYLATADPMEVFGVGHTYSDLTDGSHTDIVAEGGDLDISGVTVAEGYGATTVTCGCRPRKAS